MADIPGLSELQKGAAGRAVAIAVVAHAVGQLLDAAVAEPAQAMVTLAHVLADRIVGSAQSTAEALKMAELVAGVVSDRTAVLMKERENAK